MSFVQLPDTPETKWFDSPTGTDHFHVFILSCYPKEGNTRRQVAAVSSAEEAMDIFRQWDESPGANEDFVVGVEDNSPRNKLRRFAYRINPLTYLGAEQHKNYLWLSAGPVIVLVWRDPFKIEVERWQHWWSDHAPWF